MTDDQQLTHNLQALHTDEDPNPAFADALFARLEDEITAPPRSSRTWMLLAAAALIAVLATGAAFGSGLVRVPWLIADADATLEPTATVESSPSAPESPSNSAEPTPGPTATATPPAPALFFARVASPGLALRDAPGLDAEIIDRFAGGEIALVVAGPVVSDGYDWYQLSALGLPPNTGCAGDPVEIGPLGCPTWLGWAAAASLEAADVWLEPTTRDCADSPMTMQQLALARGDMERLGCYPDETVTVRGWWPASPGEGLGGACASGPPAGWLYCDNTNYNLVLMDDMEHDEGVGLKAYIDPESGVTMPERGQWIEIVGHFDDPAALGCAENAALNGDVDEDPDRVVLICRTRLVVDSVEAVSGPF